MTISKFCAGMASLWAGMAVVMAVPPTDRTRSASAFEPPATAATTASAPVRSTPPGVLDGTAVTCGSNAGIKNLRVNFRGVPLDTVLDYLSEAAGLIIIQETEVKGTIDVWSRQPMNLEEAVSLLDSALNRNGYAAIREGRTLTIVSRDEARKRGLPVKVGSDPQAVAKTDQMVTQIIPVRYADAAQLVKDLQPLLPSYALLTANESGNALVLTDTQSDIRRMMQIVQALDTTLAGSTSVRLLPLRYADAKDLAAVVKELYPATSNSGQAGRGTTDAGGAPTQFAGGPGGDSGPGGGGPGGDMGPGGSMNSGGGSAGTGGQTASRRAAPSVTAVADERTNALIVRAPDDAQAIIEKLATTLDNNAESITELRVFRLKNADPEELADLLGNLFPDDTQTSKNRSAVQSGGGPMGGPPGAATTESSTSTRAQQKGKVTAVADARTTSLIVSAGKDLMPHVARVIAQLDASPAKKQKVFVYSLENAGSANVQQVLQDMFLSQNTRSSSSSSARNTDALTTRQNQNIQSSSQSSSSSGNNSSRGSGSGSSSSLP